MVTLSRDEAEGLMQELATAMSYSHSNGLIALTLTPALMSTCCAEHLDEYLTNFPGNLRLFLRETKQKKQYNYQTARIMSRGLLMAYHILRSYRAGLLN